jgi:hypothetical protein
MSGAQSAEYKLGLVRAHDVSQDRSATEPADDNTFFCGNGNANHYLGTGFFICKGISAIKKGSLLLLRCHI